MVREWIAYQASKRFLRIYLWWKLRKFRHLKLGGALRSHFPMMSPHSEPGTRVVFAFPDNGYPIDRRTADACLVKGHGYYVANTLVTESGTRVCLLGFPGWSFNSVLFTSSADLEAAARECEARNNSN